MLKSQTPSQKPRQVKEKGILSYFPGTPREVQKLALEELEKKWNEYDVFVLSLTVGSGKSRVAYTIGKWANAQLKKQTRILTPSNILVEQYKKDFEKLASIKKKSEYKCCLDRSAGIGFEETCASYYQREGRHCYACHYVDKVKANKKAPLGVYNYYTFLAHKFHAPVLVFDEAHNVINLLRSMAAKRLWQHEYNYPNWVTTYGTLYNWVCGARQHKDTPTLKLLQGDLEANSQKYLVKRSLEYYHGKEKDCLSLLPLDVTNEKPVLWNKAEKIILMSGTINLQDVHELGLGKKRVCVIDLPSPIPEDRRPIHYVPIGSMAAASQDANIPVVAAYIKELMSKHPGKGLIHATYSLAEKLKEFLGSDSRLLFHSREDKMDRYKEFRETPDPKVFVASGLYEGVDLAGQDYTWQVIVKIPFASLGEPAIRYKAENDEVWYKWDTMKTVLQACGRICRGPEDFGITYIIDTSWRKLYSDSKEKRLIPLWWLQSYSETSDLAKKPEGVLVPERVNQGEQGRSVVDSPLPQPVDTVPRPQRRFH